MQLYPKSQRAPSYELVFDDGRVRRIFNLTPPKTLIGTDESCGIRLREGEADPIQAEIEFTENGLILFHRGNKHQTRVDGHKVEVAHLKGVERLTLGSRSFRLQRSHLFLGGPPTASTEYGRREYASAFLESLRDAGKRTPFLLLSGLVHLLIWFLVSESAIEEPKARVATLNTGFDEPKDFVSEVIEEPEKEIETDVEEPEAPEEIDPSLVDTTSEDKANLEESPIEEQINPTGLGLLKTLSGSGGLPDGGSRGFNTMVGHLRSVGLDLVVVFDSTGSMEDFLQAVKSDVAEMINVISLIVPDFRIGLITYKGTPDLGASSLFLDLTSDRFQVINFLDGIDSRGGSRDARSAVTEGMKRAIQEASWRASTERVIVLIGDAPPFLGEAQQLQGFSRQFNGRLSTIYKNSGGVTERDLQEETVSAWKDLAQNRGEFAFYDGEGSVVRRLVYASLGSKYSGDIDRVFNAQRQDWRNLTVGRRVAAKDYDWLFKRLVGHRVHPAIVDGLVKIGGRYVAERTLGLLREGGHKNPWLVPRLIHILRRVTLKSSIDYNETGPDWMRGQQVENLRATIDRAFPSSRDRSMFKR